MHHSRTRTLWIPWLVFLAASVGLVLMWHRLRQHEDELLHTRTETTTCQVAYRIETFIETRLHMIGQMVRLWQHHQINTPERFAEMASALQAEFTSFQAINWVDADGVIRWLVPEDRNLPAKDRDLRGHAGMDDILCDTVQAGVPRSSPPVELFQGGRGFGTYFPLFREGRHEGFINGVFRMKRVVEDCLKEGVRDEFYIRITDGNELYSDVPAGEFENTSCTRCKQLHVLDRTWTVHLLPKPQLVAAYSTLEDEWLLGVGLLLAAGLALTLRAFVLRQAAVQESEARLRLAVENMPVMVAAFDRNGRILAWNRQSERITGYAASEMIGNPHALERLLPEGASCSDGTKPSALGRDASPGDREYLVRCRDGQVRTIAWSNASDRVQVPGWATWGVGLDVTERRRAEHQLWLTQLAVENASIATFWVGPDAGLKYVNEAACRSLGYTRQELLGLTIWDIDPAFPRDNWQEHWARMIECQESIIFETVHRRKDGTEFPVEITARYVRYGDEEYHFAFARDLTERKRAEQQRLEMERAMLESQKLESLGLLAGGVAHDFNNLLTAMLGSASLARTSVDARSPLAGYLAHIESAAQQAADLARQLLAYSGKGKFVVEKVEVGALVEQIGQLLRVSIPRRVELKYQVADEPLYVEADVAQLRQIIMNLVVNAGEAIGENEGTITLRTGRVQADRAYLADMADDFGLADGPYIVLEVSDTGCGMDAATQEKIFDPFFTTKGRGRGLGLAAALGIVRGHGGGIRIYSEPGKGTTFKILLPSTEPPTESTPTGPSAAPSTATGGMILVVDDEHSVRVVASMILKEGGFTVLTASDGVDGVEVFREHADEIRAVLLDMTMPRMSGKEALVEMRRIRPDVPVVLSSGYNEQEATNEFAGHGAVGFIQKPYRADQLLDRIQEVLNQRSEPS